MKNKIKLAKFLSQCGVASRREAEKLIKAGLVKINGEVVSNVATRVEEDALNVKVNNKLVKPDKRVYYLLHKPVGYLSSVKDSHHKKFVTQLVPKDQKVFPVGRLDKDSSGLILMTNDGELTNKLTHPSNKVEKTYIAKVNRKIDKADADKLKKGIKLTEGIAKADKVKVVNSNTFEIVLHQGWNRQIRRMLGFLNYKVEDLKRTAEGKLKIGNLAVGKYKEIKKEDIL